MEARPTRFYIPFPGGKTIGLLMLLNLLAAHGIKFKFQASGTRLLAGLGVTALGVCLTYLVVASRDGTITSGMSEAGQDRLWYGIALGLASLWAWSAYGLLTIPNERKQARIYTAVGGLTALAAFLFVFIKLFNGEKLLDANNTRILWQLIQAQLAGLALLAGTILLFRKRAGVVLLHAGILLLMCNEMVVSWLHHEWKMNIREDATAWYAHDIEHFDLTVTRVEPDPKNADRDMLRVVTIPWELARDYVSESGDKILKDERLPCDLAILRYYENATTRRRMPGEPGLADKGLGLTLTAEEKRRTGASDSDKADAPVIWVRVLKKGTNESLGTFMLNAASAPVTKSIGSSPKRATTNRNTIWRSVIVATTSPTRSR
ncbi:MAG: hypothetical protein QM811_15870 [Pirellulales bacterium]